MNPPHRPQTTPPAPTTSTGEGYIHICIYTYIYVYTFTNKHTTYVYTCTCTCTYIYIYIYIYICMYIYIYMYVYIYVYIYIYILYLYMCIYIYIYYIYIWYPRKTYVFSGFCGICTLPTQVWTGLSHFLKSGLVFLKSGKSILADPRSKMSRGSWPRNLGSGLAGSKITQEDSLGILDLGSWIQEKFSGDLGSWIQTLPS